jgi:DNA repair exonuclease SbcCD nuclease subunit
MKLPALITSDLHLVSNESAAYRWDLFPWLNETIAEERVKTLLILGDITDAKDQHRAELVNKIVAAIASLKVPEIIILSGNHDWLQQGHEFFKFLNMLPNVQFITQPREDLDVKGESAFYLPYSKQPAKDWAGFDLSHYRWVFMHQTIKGSISSNGQEMEGEDLPDLTGAGKIYSGDIHVPQVIGPIEYCGSPYHVHFGDKFKPRCVLLERNGNAVDLHFNTISRVTVAVGSIKELRRQKFRAGDQVKLRVQLAESEKHEWSRIKREAQAVLADQGVQIHGIELVVGKSDARLRAVKSATSYSPEDSILRFVEQEDLTASAYEAAMEILE